MDGPVILNVDGASGCFNDTAHVLATRTNHRANLVWFDSNAGDTWSIFGQLGTRFVFAADELYLKAGRAFPELAAYEDLAQIENGIGLIPQFRAQAAEVLSNAEPLDLPPISLVTGVSASADLKAFADRLAEKCGLDLRVHVVKNCFFSGFVTVAGLLTGRDLIEQLADEPLGEILLVPDVMLREGEELFLDDTSVSDLADQLDVQVEVVAADPWGVWDMLDTLAMERNA